MRQPVPSQLDPSIYSAPWSTPELDLIVAILKLTLHDLKIDQYKAEAAAFVASQDFEIYCDWLNWDAAVVRAALLHVKEI